ncbi:MAG: hypothetical protein LBD03_06085 [Methanobrevibacter sp.]|jgi:hypothetical protein|nr:hypothetical protein [Candidatus Methanovirga procula]
MFKKILSLVLIAILAISSVGSVTGSDKFLTVYAKTQDNNGDGSLLFYNTNDDYIAQLPINKGETVTVNLTQFPGVDHIDFQSVGRHMCYNANLHFIDRYMNLPCWENVTNIHVSVNFYKKACYDNKMIIKEGWFKHGGFQSGEERYFDPTQNALFDCRYPVLEQYWNNYP